MDQEKNTKDIDFGTESTNASADPKIIRYTEDIKVSTPSPNTAPVDPKAAAPTTQQASTNAQKPATTTPPSSPINKQKALLGCLGAFGGVMIILLILSFIFLAQAEGGQSPIAKLLGVDQASFVNGLITFVHTVFILISLVTFVFTMVGFFRAGMAKKGDLIAKRAGLRMGFVSMGILLFVLVVWGFVYVFLDDKRIQVEGELIEPIVTQPEDTLNLSAPVEIIFNASNVPVDKDKFQIVSHNWDFGDKSSDTGQIVSHIYKEKGIYDVELLVNVRDKSTGEVSTGGEYHLTVSITNQALAAIFSADPQSGEVPLEVEFDATESVDPDGNIKDYEWDFDNDGEFDDATGIKVKNKFTKIGKYKVSLRVTSSTGEFNVAEKEIDVVKDESPLAEIEVIGNPANFTVGVNYTFSADKSTSPNGKIEKYEWDFNDASKVQTTKTVSHIFKNEGTYEIYLKVTDEKGEEGEKKMKVVVGSPKGTPKAKIKTEPAIAGDGLSLNGKVPFTVTFDARESTDTDRNIIDYSWDFNDDDKADAFGDRVSYTFNEEGTFNVKLSVSDSDKNVGIATLPVKVDSQGIVAKLKADVIDGTVPLTVQFDASGSTYDKGSIISYEWDFGDGTPKKIGAALINHKYAAIGTYTAVVTAVSSDNTRANKSVTITVREIPLSACFVSVFETGPAPLQTTFDPGCSTGTISNYFWEFGDGSTSTDIKPTYTFKNPGQYRVTLEVSDSESTVDKAELIINVQ